MLPLHSFVVKEINYILHDLQSKSSAAPLGNLDPNMCILIDIFNQLLDGCFIRLRRLKTKCVCLFFSEVSCPEVTL